MSDDLTARRRFFAEEVETVGGLRSARLVAALASVPRERFVGVGPWTYRSEADMGAPSRHTADADPARVYHNVAIALDPSRQLFNGQPSLISMLIDRLALAPGDTVLHLGCGTGYFTALMAEVVGPAGHVVAVEADDALAALAASNLADHANTTVLHAQDCPAGDGRFDAVLMNAGLTHPIAAWLDRMTPGGRLMLPLTATMPAMGPIGKGPVVLLSHDAAEGRWVPHIVTFVAIYSAVGLRDDAVNAQLGAALQKNPFPRLERLRLDAHDKTDTCWLHAPGACLSIG